MNYFSHSGDLGDIIYALPTIKAAGGGSLALFHSPGRTREAMTQERADLIIPLLRLQPYIVDITFSEHANDSNLNGFRNHWQHGNLADMHLATYGFTWEQRVGRWLVVDRAETVAPVVFHRSPRYHNDNFGWQRIVDHYRSCSVFVGALMNTKHLRRRSGISHTTQLAICSSLPV